MNTIHADSIRKPNRLIHEKSPYLLQHAHNPVDWYPWGEEAFAAACGTDRPIFLSVGYSTCHWCHVMERESFESEPIAAIMNKHFVCIKVDREERPDVDRVYMSALQSMGQHGGWPMSMFLTPDLQPFYGGTYYPPQDRYGRIGLPELLHRIRHLWENDREKVLQSAGGLTEFLRQASSSPGGDATPGNEVAETCFKHIAGTYDAQWGGFGSGPKFPRPSVFSFLTTYFKHTGNPDALNITTHTLRKMSEGGMYDHVGGGFHRYSVDGEWRVPHFEKMLYDQAQLVNAFLDAYLITNDEHVAGVARDVLRYVARDLTAPDGAFYSAEDADSPHPDSPEEQGEGAFYIWSKQELEQHLGNDAALFCYHYGVEEAGNALVDPQREFTGKNILFAAHPLSRTSQHFHLEESAAKDILARCKARLLNARSRRPRPHLDDKILTSWNGLMIGAFARAGQALGEAQYLHCAERAAACVLEKLHDKKRGVLLRRYRDGEAKGEAHLEDYVFLVAGLTDLYETSFEIVWLERAVELTHTMLRLFRDENRGGFFDTSGSDPSILVRTKETYDGAEPSGNSVAVSNLLRLSQMTGKPEWKEMAESALQCFSPIITMQPSVLPLMVTALQALHHSMEQIVIAGEKEDQRTQELVRVVHSRFLPGRVLMVIHPERPLALLAPFTREFTMLEGKPTAYVCENFVCQLPVNDPDALASLLRQT